MTEPSPFESPSDALSGTHMTVRIGSLFSGYGGLELGVQAVLGGSTAWVSDIDPGACRILAHRYPHVPNLGDIERVGLDYADAEWVEIKAAERLAAAVGEPYDMPRPDWSTVEPVDVLTGGFPCQDVSHAGARKGLGPATRSGLWSRMADAIDHLRPSLVIAENVRGLLSAEAASDVEPCPWCLGDGGGEPPLRALGAVLADLAELGYDAGWYSLRASDVGAPHGRFRVFVLAWPAGTALGDAPLRGCFDAGEPSRSRRNREREVSPGGSGGLAADAGSVGWDGGGRVLRGRRPAAERIETGGHAGYEGGARTPTHSDGQGPQGAQPAAGRFLPDGCAPADTTRHGWDEGRPEPARLVGGPDAAFSGDALADADGASGEACVGRPGAGEPRRLQPVVDSGPAWGPYEPAIRRWERVLGRAAPAPTEPGSKGQPRLSPAFVEWMMGLPAGWVTQVPGLSRNEQLKALGNGVVPQQAAAAIAFLIMHAGQSLDDKQLVLPIGRPPKSSAPKVVVNSDDYPDGDLLEGWAS